MSDPIVLFDEAAMRGELRELVRRTVEDTLNALLEEEADDLIGADRYERTAGREAYRAGHYERGLTTTSGQVTLRMPKLKGMRFATAIIERYKRRETSVEEAMIEMYLAGVSPRRIEDVSEILWGASVSASTCLDDPGRQGLESQAAHTGGLLLLHDVDGGDLVALH
ncbi:transposase, partial [Adlercreutzia sp. DFI.6.23]|uniref:transposase n=1 Tax=Adlercreutzia sp. DFI.6.23 TaxID=2963705 RepID=UPI00210A57B4